MNLERDQSTPEIPGGRRSVIALAIMAGVCVFGVFSPGAPLQALHGIAYVAAGATMLILPPRMALPGRWWVLAGLMVALSGLAFLPKGPFFDPDWRKAVEELGAKTGPFVTAHARQTSEHWIALGITGVVGLYLLGHRVSEQVRPWLVGLVALGIAAYAGVCIGVEEQHWKWAWDPVEAFGLFPNRNHTATVLVMGTLCGLSVMVQAIRTQGGGGALAGMAAAAGSICVGALLGYSESRAGVVLLVIGAAIWVAGLGLKRWSRRTVGVVVVLGGLVAWLFAMSDADIKSRLASKSAPASVPPAVDGAVAVEPAPSFVERAVQSEGRLAIYRDTAALLRAVPWTGVGLGMFEFVFPQFMRVSSTESRCLHPESDWLLMAAETGIPATLVLAGLVGSVAVAAVRHGRRWRGWTLRSGCLVAALVVPVHGLFDVPGHHLGLAWSALLLTALSFRIPEPASRPGWISRGFFSLCGTAVLGVGLFLIHAEWGGGPTSAVVQPDRSIAEARALLAADRVEHQAPPEGAPADPPTATDAADPGAATPIADSDRLIDASRLVQRALAVAPLHPDLHNLRGVIALHFEGMDRAVDRAFAIQRRLDPVAVQVPLWQAEEWAGLDPERSAVLWAEAMERVAAIEAVAVKPVISRPRVMEIAMGQVRAMPAGQDDLGRNALALAGADPELILIWVQSAPAGLLNEEMPALLAAEADPERRKEWFGMWKRHDGARLKVKAFVDEHPEFTDAP